MNVEAKATAELEWARAAFKAAVVRAVGYGATRGLGDLAAAAPGHGSHKGKCDGGGADAKLNSRGCLIGKNGEVPVRMMLQVWGGPERHFRGWTSISKTDSDSSDKGEVSEDMGADVELKYNSARFAGVGDMAMIYADLIDGSCVRTMRLLEYERD